MDSDVTAGVDRPTRIDFVSSTLVILVALGIFWLLFAKEEQITDGFMEARIQLCQSCPGNLGVMLGLGRCLHECGLEESFVTLMSFALRRSTVKDLDPEKEAFNYRYVTCEMNCLWG